MIQTAGFGRDTIAQKMPRTGLVDGARILFCVVVGYCAAMSIHHVRETQARVNYLEAYSTTLSGAYADLTRACFVGR